MSARLFDDTPRALPIRMDYRDQLARRLCRGTIKNKPTTAPAADLLQPQRPAPARRRAISPTVTRNQRKPPRNNRQTTRPAPMPQRIKPRTRQTIYALRHDDTQEQTPKQLQPNLHPCGTSEVIPNNRARRRRTHPKQPNRHAHDPNATHTHEASAATHEPPRADSGRSVCDRGRA
jgi:hypothetical protein